MSGIYLHIPFCKQACSYCDFYFVTRTGYRGRYVDRLVAEIEQYRESAYTAEPVRSVYFGGGTPSLLEPGQVGRILDALRSVFELKPEEVTFEMNPDDVNRSYLEALRELGITRSSMGVQTFKPELLSFMNRAHTREEALQCLNLLKDTGFPTFTVDLIYGNPGQSLEDLNRDLDTLLSFSPPHVSAYSLTVEPKTRLGKQVELGRVVPPEDDTVSDHYDLVVERLAGEGIIQYEVSNYSRPGHEAFHNSSYWRHENYLGLGPGAHSFWWKGDLARRWSNPSDLKAYLGERTGTGPEEERLSSLQLAEERLMLGLRTREGVAVEELENRYGYQLSARQHAYIESKEEEGKFVADRDCLHLTTEGRKLADAILLDLITMN